MSKTGSRISHFANILLILIVPHLLWISMIPSLFFGFWNIATPVILVFVITPILDIFSSPSRKVPHENQLGVTTTAFLKISPLLYVLCFSTLFVFQIYMAIQLDAWNFVVSAVSFSVMGTILIAAAHELIHKRQRVSRVAGEFVFVMFGYWHFPLAHIHNHHALVATDADNHAPGKGQNFWRYMMEAYPKAVSFSYRLLKQRQSKGQISSARFTCLLTAYLCTPIVLATVAFSFAGPIGLIFYVSVAIFSLLFAEAVFYIQHYNVKRRRDERIAAHHSWDSDHRFSNYLTFMVQRHGDHHLKWGRDYYLLRAHQNSLYLPLGYPLMLVLALIPPVFFKVMDPRAEALSDTEEQLSQT
ncbi:MAG: fatty acid desaturase [Sneathiella sp.]|nr:fatty acid desaturase [Sneathiella sp.]